MANPTPTAVLAQIAGQSLVTALANVGGPLQNLDVLQIVDDNGNNVLLNVDFNGVVRKPATSNQSGAADNTRLGQFQTTLSSSASVAQLFANAFTNPSNLDIIQVINVGGNVSYWLDFLGVAHGA